MTDTVPFAPVTAVDGEPPSGERKKLMVLGGVAGVLVLAAGGYFLLGGGGSDDSASGPVITHVVKPHNAVTGTKPAGTAAKPVKAVKPVTLPAASTTRLGRDPFKPLFVAPVEGGSAAAGTGGPVTTPTATSTAPASTPTIAATAPYALQLKSIDSSSPAARRFTFNVGGVSKKVVTGQKFGKYGELVVLSVVTDSRGRVTGALVQVGDSDPSTMSLGEKSTVA